jgi:phosphoribosylformylglycinamidine synthase
VSDGGLFICLLESAMPNGLGFSIKGNDSIRQDAYLFGESQSRVVVSAKPGKEKELEAYLSDSKVPFTQLGEITGSGLEVGGKNFGSLDDYRRPYMEILEEKLSQ